MKTLWAEVEKAWAGRTQDRVEHTAAWLTRLEANLRKCAKDELLSFEAEFHECMYLLDRSDIAAEASDHGDDGFMDVRAFNIALGEAHVARVFADPSVLVSRDLEGLLYLARRVIQYRFGYRTRPLHPLVKGSNPEGWPGLIRA